jgi:hypothetical protein
MPQEIEITVQRDELGGLEAAPDLTDVKVLINGAVANRIGAERDAITVKALLADDGPWIILLTTPDGKKLLHALDLNFDPESETFNVKLQQGIGTEEPASDDEGDKAEDTIATAIRDAALGDKLDRAADTIAAAIREAARALRSKAPVEREKNR